MRNIFVLLFCLLLSNNVLLNAIVDKKKEKSIEFSIGGNFVHSFLLQYYNFEVYEREKINYRKSVGFWFLSCSLKLSFVFGFDYYLNQKSTFGLTSSLGYGFSFIVDNYKKQFYIINSLVYNLKFNNKFGKLSKKTVVLEYGISLQPQFYYTKGDFFYQSYKNSLDSLSYGYAVDWIKDWTFDGKDNLFFYFKYGPTFLVGYEAKLNKNSKLLIGGTFDISLSYIEEKSEPNIKECYFFMDICPGIEFRFSFYSIKKLK